MSRISQREAFERCKAALLLRGYSQEKINAMVIQPDYIRVDQALVNTSTTYSFNIQSTSATTANEAKLDINDSFYVTHLGILLYNGISTDPHNKPLVTYPNTSYFGTGTNFDFQDLEIIYNVGRLSYKVQTRTVLENLPIRDCRYVPQTQQSSATNKSQQEALDGLIPMTPEYFVQGSANNQFVLNIPLYNSAAINWAHDAANNTNYVVMLAQGFKIKNMIIE